MQLLRANTAVIVRIGPFVDVGDGFTPQTDITLAGDEAELLKAASVEVDISSNTWAATTGCRGWYDLTLSTTDTNTEGTLTVVIQDDSDCLPVVVYFMVMAEAAWDSMFAAKDTGYMDVNIKAISEDTTSPANLELMYDGTGYAGGTIKLQSDLTQILAHTLTDTGTQLADAFQKFFNVATPTGTVNSLPDAVPGAAGGLPVSAAGSLAMDTLADWVDGGRLDALLDAIPTTAMRGTDNAALASVLGALNNVAAAGEVTDADTLMQYIKQLLNVLIGAAGIAAFPAEAAPGNAVSLSEVIRAIHTDVTGLNGAAMKGTDGVSLVIPDAAGVAATPAEVATALENIHLDHLLAVEYDPASKPGVATALLNEIVESDAGVSRFTENALEQAPSGTGASAATIADAVWEEAIADHTTGTTFGGKNQKVVPSETIADYKATGFNTVEPDPAGTAPTAADVKTAIEAAGSHLTLIKAQTDDLANGERLDLIIDNILTDTNELQADNIPGTLATITGYLDNEIAAIKAVTDVIPNAGALTDLALIKTQTDDLANGARLDLLIDAIKAQTDDLADGARLDLLIDAIKAVTDVIPNAGALTDLATAVDGVPTTAEFEARTLSTEATVKLEASAGSIVVAAAAAGTLSTTAMTTTLTEITDDHYNGRIIIWTSGVLQNQATNITDYDGATKMLTYTAVTEAPTADDTFVIV